MQKILQKIEFLNPYKLLVFFFLGFLWLLTRLPIAWQKSLGRMLGTIFYHCSSKMKHTACKNIEICFKNLTPVEQKILVKKNFQSLGEGLVETAMAWWLPNKKLNHCEVKIHGAEHLSCALAKGKGVILLGPHFLCLEIIGRLLGARYNFATMYRPHKKPFLNKLLVHFRQKYNIKCIPKHKMRELLRTLKQNTAVWYAYDIDAGTKNNVFAPFFGIETSSMTAVTRLVELSGAAIVPVSFYRMENKFGYEIFLQPEIVNFPTGTHVGDAQLLNNIVETAIKRKPEEYIWQYKRFKTRPQGEARIY